MRSIVVTVLIGTVLFTTQFDMHKNFYLASTTYTRLGRGQRNITASTCAGCNNSNASQEDQRLSASTGLKTEEHPLKIWIELGA